jgi:hypothetical protein
LELREFLFHKVDSGPCKTGGGGDVEKIYEKFDEIFCVDIWKSHDVSFCYTLK